MEQIKTKCTNASVTTHSQKTIRLINAMKFGTFISVVKIFKLPRIGHRNLWLAIEIIKSSFQVPIASFQCLKGNLLAASSDNTITCCSKDKNKIVTAGLLSP
jgi:hypothetical protein